MKSDSSRRPTENDDPFGIVMRFKDTFGQWKETGPLLRAQLMEAMGLGPSATDEDLPPPSIILGPGGQRRVERPAELLLEDGTELRITGTIPPDLPNGYHRLRPLDGDRTVQVIKRPATCFLRRDMKTWGWAVQLYASRSRQSWGIGDLGDLCRLARWSAAHGAGVLLLNPLGAVAPAEPLEASPYYPSSRRFRNPLYIDVSAVASAAGTDEAVAAQARLARQLNQDRRIDRNAVFRQKLAALKTLWRRAAPGEAFESYCRMGGSSLQTFGRYCALVEDFGVDWREWPEQLRRPDSPAVQRHADQRQDRVRFHLWLQWLLDEQLRTANDVLPLVQDLPIGVDPRGVDAWQWQDVMATNVTIGAPPDQFNTLGQDWALPPFVPHRLREEGFQPFIETLRAAFRHSGGLRIDHVMGLFRLYWIPRGLGPQHGAYVRYPSEELLAIVAIESERAGAWVAGEDLGTVEKTVRKRLADNAMLSYKLMWFEDTSPTNYPTLSMAAITTHDLPTIAGLWSGADFEDQRKIGLSPSEEGARQLRGRLIKAAGVANDDSTEDVVRKAYAALGDAASTVAVVNLDDAQTVAERTNMPGTIDQWPNWCQALPQPIEELEQATLPRAIAEALSANRPDGRGDRT